MHPGCLDIWLIALRILPTMSMETMNIMTTIIMLLLLIIAMNDSQNIWCAPIIQIIFHKKRINSENDSHMYTISHNKQMFNSSIIKLVSTIVIYSSKQFTFLAWQFSQLYTNQYTTENVAIDLIIGLMVKSKM